MDQNRSYLGDGVYVSIECGMIKLTTSDGIRQTNEIFLEHEVYEALIKYVNRIKEQASQEVDS